MPDDLTQPDLALVQAGAKPMTVFDLIQRCDEALSKMSRASEARLVLLNMRLAIIDLTNRLDEATRRLAEYEANEETSNLILLPGAGN